MIANLFIWVILWYVIGVIGNFIGLVFYQGFISVKDLLVALVLSCFGIIMLVFTIYLVLDNKHFFDKVLWIKKD